MNSLNINNTSLYDQFTSLNNALDANIREEKPISQAILTGKGEGRADFRDIVKQVLSYIDSQEISEKDRAILILRFQKFANKRKDSLSKAPFYRNWFSTVFNAIKRTNEKLTIIQSKETELYQTAEELCQKIEKGEFNDQNLSDQDVSFLLEMGEQKIILPDSSKKHLIKNVDSLTDEQVNDLFSILEKAPNDKNFIDFLQKIDRKKYDKLNITNENKILNLLRLDNIIDYHKSIYLFDLISSLKDVNQFFSSEEWKQNSAKYNLLKLGKDDVSGFLNRKIDSFDIHDSDKSKDKICDDLIKLCLFFQDKEISNKTFNSRIAKSSNSLLRLFLEKSSGKLSEDHPVVQIVNNELAKRKTVFDPLTFVPELQAVLNKNGNNTTVKLIKILNEIPIVDDSISVVFQEIIKNNEKDFKSLRSLIQAFQQYTSFGYSRSKDVTIALPDKQLLAALEKQFLSPKGRSIPYTLINESSDPFDQSFQKKSEHFFVFQHKNSAHVSPIYHWRENSVDHFAILDSCVGPENNDPVERFLKNKVKSDFCIYTNVVPRQSDNSNCRIFALHDYNQLNKINSKLLKVGALPFTSFVKKHAIPSENANIFTLEQLPSYLLKASQRTTELKQKIVGLSLDEQDVIFMRKAGKAPRIREMGLIEGIKNKQMNGYIFDKFIKEYISQIRDFEKRIND